MRASWFKSLTGITIPVVFLVTGSVEAQQTVRQWPSDRPVLQRRIPNAVRKGAFA